MTYLRAFKGSVPIVLSPFSPSLSPQMKKQLHKCLGAAGYHHQWIPDFAALAKSVCAVLPDTTPEPIPWPSEALPSFEALELALSTPPALGLPTFFLFVCLFCFVFSFFGLPTFDKPFHQYCHENNGIASGILGEALPLRYIL